MKKWLFIIFIFLHQEIRAQIISTYAGPGIYDPNCLAFDNHGNLFITSAAGYQIFKIDTSGLISVIAGTGTSGFSGDGGPATAAKLNQPVGIAIDSLNNIIFTDVNNNRIRKINVATGVITTIIGNDTAGFYGDGGPASAASLFLPGSICFDNAGNFYIGEVGNYRVRKVNTSGIISTIAGTGVLGSTGDGGPATAAECYPSGVCTDNIGNLYIAEYGVVGSTCRVRKVNTSGIISTITGDSTICTYNGDGIPATAAYSGAAIISIHQGLLYLSDGCNNRVRMIDNSGIIHTVAGDGIAGFSGDNGPADSAEMHLIAGITFDSCGNLYISDIDNTRIRKVSFNPYCWPEKVNNIATQSIIIYPNPTYETVNVNNITSQTSYEILNINGIIEQTGILQQGNNSIAIETLPPGVYILEMIDEEGNKIIKKIVKE